jgi:hypothetical protein
MATYFRYDLWAKTAQGPALAGIQVWVCSQPTTNTTNTPPAPLATVYSDPLGANQITQPIQTDGFGHADFYALAGLYTVIIAIGGVIQNVYPDQNLGNGGLNVTITGSPVAGQALVATSPTTASWQTIAGTVLNYPAVPNQFLNSYTAATGTFTSAQSVLSGIGNPTSNVNFVFNTNTFYRSYSQLGGWNEALVNTSIATASVNYSSPSLAFIGSIWNGTSGVPDAWAIYTILSAGANPVSDLYIYHANGTTGLASIYTPNIIVTGNATFSGIIYDNNASAGLAGQVLTSTSSGVVWSNAGTGNVSSVSNSDGTLTVSPNTGAVIASLALSHANTWTGLQTFTNEQINGTLADGTASVGIPGQALTSTGTSTAWANVGASFSGNGAFFFGPGINNAMDVYNSPNWGEAHANLISAVGTANTLLCYLFQLFSTYTISKASVVAGNTIGGVIATFGIYAAENIGSYSAGQLVLNAGQFNSDPSGTVQTNTFAPVTLLPGTYWHVQAADSTSSSLEYQPAINISSAVSNTIIPTFLANYPNRCVVAGNGLSGGNLPATLGTLTPYTPSNSNADGIVSPLYE